MKLKNKLFLSTAVLGSFAVVTPIVVTSCSETQQNPVDGNKINFVDLTKYEKMSAEIDGYTFNGSVGEGNEFNKKSEKEVKDLLGITGPTGTINAEKFSKLISGIEFKNVNAANPTAGATLSTSGINAQAIDVEAVKNAVTIANAGIITTVTVQVSLDAASEFTWADGSKSTIGFVVTINNMNLPIPGQ